MMKKYLFISVIVSISFLLIQCSNQIAGPDQIKKIALTELQKKVGISSDEFGLNLLKKLDESNKNENIFISPLSVSMDLGMTMNGAEGSTLDEMRSTLGYAGLSQDEINKTFKDLIKLLTNADPKVAMQIANSIWYKNNFYVEQNFINVNKNYFDALVRSIDFSDPSSVDAINNWVNENTNGKINKIISEIPKDAVMYLINAIYFKGAWKYEFDKSNTTDRNFYLADGSTVLRKFMSQEGNYNCLSNNLIQAVDLPYGDSSFSMMVILPKPGQSINTITGQLNRQKLVSWINDLSKQECTVILPKFKIECEYELNDPLIDLGMKSAFNPGDADFTKINKNGGLFISKVKHKTYVDVNEEGTEAAAATSVEISKTSVEPSPLIINVNRPFLFVIKENSSNTILFAGKIMNPIQD